MILCQTTLVHQSMNDYILQHFLQITTLLDTMMKEVSDVKEAAEGISELKRKLAEVFLMVEANMAK